MPFSDAFRKVSIKQGILTAECRKNDQKTWISSSINLDDFLGNVDGKFVLGGKGFSQSAQDITLVDAVISAKLKNSAGKYVDAKFDLSNYVSSQDGIIAAHGSAATQVAERPALAAIQGGAASSVSASMSSMAASHLASLSSVSHSASQSTSHHSVSHSSSHSSGIFKSSSFRHFSQELLIEEVCNNFVLKGTFLHCDVHHEDGRVTHTSFDLDVCIGIVDGRLVWDASGFSKASSDIALDGLWLTVKFRHPVHHDEYIAARLDLRTRLRLKGDVIIFVETSKSLSMVLSEVPWMKFKVIAEPDLSVFGTHPVVQKTMIHIAENTVKHVTQEMHKMMTAAMETAIIAITESAIAHISAQMQHTVRDTVGYTASPSATQSEFLNIGAAAALFSGGYSAGGAAYGAAYGAHSASTHDGFKYGASYGSGGVVQHSSGNVLTNISRSVSESSSISTSSTTAHSEASSTSVATHKASAAASAAAVTRA